MERECQGVIVVSRFNPENPPSRYHSQIEWTTNFLEQNLLKRLLFDCWRIQRDLATIHHEFCRVANELYERFARLNKCCPKRFVSACKQFDRLIHQRSVDSPCQTNCDGLVVRGVLGEQGLDQPHGVLTKGKWQWLSAINERDCFSSPFVAFKSLQLLSKLLDGLVFENPFDENLAV